MSDSFRERSSLIFICLNWSSRSVLIESWSLSFVRFESICFSRSSCSFFKLDTSLSSLLRLRDSRWSSFERREVWMEMVLNDFFDCTLSDASP